jgi:hypothetical protein
MDTSGELADLKATLSDLRSETLRDSLEQVPYLHVPAGLPLHAIRQAASQRAAPAPAPAEPNVLPTAAQHAARGARRAVASAPPTRPGDPQPSGRTKPRA